LEIGELHVREWDVFADGFYGHGEGLTVEIADGDRGAYQYCDPPAQHFGLPGLIAQAETNSRATSTTPVQKKEQAAATSKSKPTATAARFHEPEPAATNSKATSKAKKSARRRRYKINRSLMIVTGYWRAAFANQEVEVGA
jgi:hypothetical protein